MTRPGLNCREETLRSAIESDDFSPANSALQAYLAWFGSEARTCADVLAARDLLQSCLEAAWARRARIAARGSGMSTPPNRKVISADTMLHSLKGGLCSRAICE